MSDEWIDGRVDAAHKACPVADAVASAIKEQLKDLLRTRPLRPPELTALAKSLLQSSAGKSGDGVKP